jgi:D-alanyl-D-alanine carboxypeptidase/L,D-transpeptidase catalytic domain
MPEQLSEKSSSHFFQKSFPLWMELLSIVAFCATVLVLLSIHKAEAEPLVDRTVTIEVPSPSATTTVLTYGSQPILGNIDFFNTAVLKLRSQGADFLVADLANMKLTVVKGGADVFSVPIATKGREGSWWETPAGLYKISSKQPYHFSSFGFVNTQWNLQFQGNFFIHGWPTYPNGTPVASTYSGGCIRLSDEDAEKVFNTASNGMPILVYEKDFTPENKTFSIAAPRITGRAYAVADIASGFMFTSKEIETEIPIASITKLMTALIATEYINLDKVVTIQPRMMVESVHNRLQVGQKVRVYELLFPLLMESSNEAAEALAQSHLERSDFIRLMNVKAKALGMEHTHFTDVSGLDDGNTSTIEDLFLLARYLYFNRSFLLSVTRGEESSEAYKNTAFKGLQNFNDMGEVAEGFIGGKIGETSAARETAITVSRITIGDSARIVVTVVLGSRDHLLDTKKLLTFARSSYK